MVQMLIPARDSLLNTNPCAALKIACMEFLSALIRQPVWCGAEENQENIGQIVELLTTNLLHANEKLADLVCDRPEAISVTSYCTVGSCRCVHVCCLLVLICLWVPCRVSPL